MIWLSACLLHRATDQIGPPKSARPVRSYTISRDSIVDKEIAAFIAFETHRFSNNLRSGL